MGNGIMGNGTYIHSSSNRAIGPSILRLIKNRNTFVIVQIQDHAIPSGKPKSTSNGQDRYLKSSYENVKSGSSTKVKEVGRPVMIQGFKNCTLEKLRRYMYGSRVVSTNRYT